ncbi:MAG: hypothetical protein ACUVV5_02220 [Candidatus Aminicenantales bacterium]
MSDEEVIRELIRFVNANNAAIYGLEPEALIKDLLDTTAEYGPMETVKQPLERAQRDRGESALGGQIAIAFKMDSSFQEMVESTDYLCFHYKGAEMSFASQDYKAIFLLDDDQRDEIETRSSALSLPDLKKTKEAAVVNCILGTVIQNPSTGRKAFSLSREDGGLEYRFDETPLLRKTSLDSAQVLAVWRRALASLWIICQASRT